MKQDTRQDAIARSVRLLQLISEIKTSPRQQPAQLCRSLQISRSQYFEDRKALAGLGFVFDYDRKLKRYLVKNDPCLPVFDLTSSEVFSLVMAVRQLSAAGDHALTYEAVNAIRKIVANAERRPRELLLGALDDVVIRRTFHVQPEFIESLRRAQQACERLEIMYDDFTKDRERRLQIDPYALFFKGRALYLDAYIPEEKKVLMLRVSRVKKILGRAGHFAVRSDYDFGQRHRHSFRVMISDQPPQEVRIRFAPHAARYIAEAHWHESQRVLHGEDGSVLLTLHVSEPREVLWYLVFPWAEDAEILEPQWLRKEAAQVARNIVAKYQAGEAESR